MESYRMRSKLLVLGASCAFGLMALFTKLATASLSGGQVILIRSLVSAIVLGFLLQLKTISFEITNARLLWLRGLLGGSAALCYFIALEHTTVGKAAILNNTSPLFVAIFSRFFLQERLTTDVWTALVIAFGGITLIMQPTFATIQFGDLIGLLSGALSGSAYLSVRALRKTESTWAIFLSFSLGGLLCSLPFLGGPWTSPSNFTLWCLLGMLATSWIAQLLLTYSLKFVKAAEGGTLGLATGVFATLWGAVILHDPLTWNFAVGASLVIGGCAWITLKGGGTKGLTEISRVG